MVTQLPLEIKYLMNIIVINYIYLTLLAVTVRKIY